jgi:photosystem II stability/assembly factor-like uncharacterized protein
MYDCRAAGYSAALIVSMKKLHILFSFVLICTLAKEGISQVNEHWEKIGRFPLTPSPLDQFGQSQGYGGYGIECAFFLDADRGWIVRSGVSAWVPEPLGTRTEIHFTTNRGKAWTKSILPLLEEGELGLSAIWMHDTAIGYAVGVADNWHDTSTIIKTTDGGRTWFVDSIGTTWWYGQYEWGYIKNVKTFPDGTPVFGDGGIAILDSNRAIIAVIDNGGVLQTLDRGKTWKYFDQPEISILGDGLGDPWGAASITSRQAFYVLPTEGSPYPEYQYVYESLDFGESWQRVSGDYFLQHALRTSDIQAAGDALYVQARRNGTVQGRVEEGFYRSTDGGRNWVHIGGPMRRPQTRFTVPANCRGNVVVGFDSTDVWMTTDGGDGKLIDIHPPVVAARPFDQIPSCLDTVSYITLDNIQCRTYVFTRAELTQAEDAFEFDTVGLFPIVLKESGHAEIPIRFDPNFRVKSFPASVKLLGYEELLSGQRQFDTTVAITATSFAVAPKLTASTSIVDFTGTSTCFTRDTTITITNTGCDTLTLDNVNGTGSAYTFSGVAVPMKLAPGEAIEVKVTFHPSTQGTHNGNLQLTATQQGITKKTDIPLSGVGTAGEGRLELLTANAVKLPELSICATGDDTLASLRNTGCAPIIVKSVAITGPADYTLQSTINNVTLAPDSAISFRIAFAPQDKGVRNASVTVNWTDQFGNNPKDITIALNANVIDGNKVLASSLNTINFGETNICEERDSVIRLTSNGCDTLTITSADIDKNFNVGGDFPIVLAPNESIDLPITTVVDTVGKPTVLTGVLNITSTADNQLAPITLTRSLYYPTKLRIEAIDEASGKAGDIVKFKVILEGEVPSTMTALHFDFLHNGDLLSWDQYDGIGLNRTNIIGNETQRSSFTLSPVHSGDVGEFSFKTNLAIADQTTLSFDKITFEAKGVSVAPECIAVISDSGSRFNYIYTCGDNIIRDRLNGTRLIKSITPNPASNEIRLELSLPGAAISVIDALGVERLQTTRDRIDVSGLANGVYYVRVASGGSVETRRIVIEH